MFTHGYTGRTNTHHSDWQLSICLCPDWRQNIDCETFEHSAISSRLPPNCTPEKAYNLRLLRQRLSYSCIGEKSKFQEVRQRSSRLRSRFAVCKRVQTQLRCTSLRTGRSQQGVATEGRQYCHMKEACRLTGSVKEARKRDIRRLRKGDT